jgi:hypothetical protein
MTTNTLSSSIGRGIYALIAVALLFSTTNAYAIQVDKQKFMQTVSSGQRIISKDGSYAVEYNISGSNYRTWWPMSSPWGNAGGIVTNIKIDHIRGGESDDHTVLELYFNPQGGLAYVRYSVNFAKSVQLNPQVVAGLAGAAGGPDAAVWGRVGATVANAIYNQIFRVDRSGGRLNFGAVVNRNIQYAAASLAR